MLKTLATKYLPAFVLNGIRQWSIKIRRIRATPSSWTTSGLYYRSPYFLHRTLFDKIEEIAAKTDERGAFLIWEGYSKVENYPARTHQGATRSSDQVRTGPKIGQFFTWLVLARKPSVIVEFGTAFGVSGMYWLAGLRINAKGHLFTFEPNAVWAEIALSNLSQISDRFTLTCGTFEDNLAVIDDQGDHIDLAFIDAIHTSDFVYAQLDLILQHAAPGALVVFDDIDFSADMRSCWNAISHEERFAAAFELNGIGVIELK
jgi:predicted O-methyltransferase YrrM